MESTPPGRILTTQTAALLRGMMEKTVREGTGRLARIPGYRVGGKTGTAQKIDPQTNGYSPTDHIANFVGFAPVNNPSIVVVIAIDSPHGEHHGGQIAAPIFPHLAAQALRFRDVPPELPVEPQKRRPEKLPPEFLAEFLNEPWVEGATSGARHGADNAILVAAMGSSEGVAAARNDAAAAAREPQTAVLAASRVALQVTDRVVPDFRGRTVRQVVAETASLGLELDAHGRGIARRQWPPAGTPVARGSTVRVAFARTAGEAAAGP
jgi:membrane peptidoglycan carboxypeptidase